MSNTAPGLPRAYQQGGAAEGLLPILGYVVGDQVGSRIWGDLAGDRIAIVAMTLASVWAIVQRLRRGSGVGWWLPTISLYLLLRGIAGLLWGEDVFLAAGIGVKVLLGLAALGSVLVRRPAAAELAPMILPFTAEQQTNPTYVSTMRVLTLSYALYQLITVGFEIWLLGETSSGTAFLVIRFLVGTVATFVGFGVAMFYVDRRLRDVPGFPGVMRQLEDLGALIEQDRSRR